jgi:1-deoxy-D-xylulose-5-phosphate reductoisomerase
VAVLGSTGSIGRQTLDVIRAHPDCLRVTGLAAGNNAALLAEQAAEFRPSLIACLDERALAARLPEDLRRSACPVSAVEMATHPDVDVVVAAMVGRPGLEPVLAALESGKTVALANKEALIMAGPLVLAAAARGGGEIRPVDSEHSAIWQCLEGEDRSRVRRLIITASGGALRDLPEAALAEVGPEEVLRHPTWRMGPKITVDSATLFNKGLEVIEARWLFGVPFESIQVVLHRESIVHSLVEMVDGSLKAQLSLPDMRMPIQHALLYPLRLPGATPPLELAALGALHFGEVDLRRYPCLALALEAGRRGDTYPAAIAAADEVAVDLFLGGGIGFLDIPRLLGDALEAHVGTAAPGLEAIAAADGWGRRFARRWAEARW